MESLGESQALTIDATSDTAISDTRSSQKYGRWSSSSCGVKGGRTVRLGWSLADAG